jgi:hypothetical protein
MATTDPKVTTTIAPAGATSANVAGSPADLIALRDRLRTLPAKKRIDAILDRPDTMRAVRSLPVLDLYATLREVGVEDTLEVLELCSPAQVQSFLDLDGWRGDRVDSEAIAGWVRALFAASTDRAISQVMGLDLELITLLFKMHATVYDLIAEEEPGDDVGLHTITPDQRYLIAFGGVAHDETMQHVLKEMIERLQARDMLFVLRMCEAIRWELPSSLEDAAFRWRNARLEDLGFLPPAEAQEIFAYLDPDVVNTGATPQRGPPKDDADGPSLDLSTSVLLPWDALNDGGTALGRALAQLDHEERARVLHEVMVLANRVHAAEGADLGDTDALRATVRRCADVVGTALSYRTRGDVLKLGEPLRAMHVATLFRIGHSLGLRLQRDLRARIEAPDSGLGGGGLVRLDSPLRELCAGLLRPKPVFYGGLVDDKRVDFSHIGSLADLAACARGLSEAAFRAALLGPKGFRVDDASLAALGIHDSANMPSHGAMLAAFLALPLLGRKHAVQTLGPVNDDTLEALQKTLHDGHFPQAARDTAIASVVEVAKNAAPLPGAASVDDAGKRAAAYAESVLGALERELGAVEHRPEGRYLGVIWSAG